MSEEGAFVPSGEDDDFAGDPVGILVDAFGVVSVGTAVGLGTGSRLGLQVEFCVVLDPPPHAQQFSLATPMEPANESQVSIPGSESYQTHPLP